MLSTVLSTALNVTSYQRSGFRIDTIEGLTRPRRTADNLIEIELQPQTVPTWTLGAGHLFLGRKACQSGDSVAG